MSLVSIIMPYYQKKEFINDSIDSILNQSYEKFEIIIVNDELSFDSKLVLKEILKKDKRIKVIENDGNIGAGQTRNNGIKFSKGEYIAFCDCDDLWKKDKLEKQINFMKLENINFSHTAYEIIDEKNNKIGLRNIKKFITFKELEKSCDIGLSTVILKKKIFDNIYFKFPKLKTKEDYVLWLKFSKNGVDLVGLNEKLTLWRKSSNSLSSNIVQKLIDGFKVYNTYLKYNKVHSFVNLLILSFNFMLKKLK